MLRIRPRPLKSQTITPPIWWRLIHQNILSCCCQYPIQQEDLYFQRKKPCLIRDANTRLLGIKSALLPTEPFRSAKEGHNLLKFCRASFAIFTVLWSWKVWSGILGSCPMNSEFWPCLLTSPVSQININFYYSKLSSFWTKSELWGLVGLSSIQPKFLTFLN
jgi:hypothetical protein